MSELETTEGLSFAVSFLFLGKLLLVLFLIFLVTLLTPKLAALIDRHRGQKERPGEDERLYQVRSVFEPAPDDEKPTKTLFPEVQEHNKTTRNEDK